MAPLELGLSAAAAATARSDHLASEADPRPAAGQQCILNRLESAKYVRAVTSLSQPECKTF